MLSGLGREVSRRWRTRSPGCAHCQGWVEPGSAWVELEPPAESGGKEERSVVARGGSGGSDCQNVRAGGRQCYQAVGCWVGDLLGL